jgi:hypothetical protein
VYAVLLLVWTAMLWHGLVLGVAYWVLYSPMALVLLVQLIYDNMVTWLLFLLFSVYFGGLMVHDEYVWAKGYQVKAAWSGWEIGIHVGFIVLEFLVYLLVIYAMRPKRKKKIAVPAVESQQ